MNSVHVRPVAIAAWTLAAGFVAIVLLFLRALGPLDKLEEGDMFDVILSPGFLVPAMLIVVGMFVVFALGAWRFKSPWRPRGTVAIKPE